ncbi:MAG: dihydrolipoyl dehydrogenase [Alphaproteobacteria bacterium]|nr:MAG: dihydrolipoyl dehydrogenase [Alphaproteobacteria bacterium]
MADTYDLIIIGAGPGGYNCAIRAAQLGLSVACVESRDTLGGTCLNVGCIPSKALLRASELYDDAQNRMAKMGVKVDKVSLDLPAMMGHKDDAVDQLTKGIAYLFKKNKVTHIVGHGRITAPGTVAVVSPKGETQTLQTKNIVIATGSDPMTLPGVEIDEQRVVSSTGALSLTSVPKHLLVIGAGYIGLEMGSVWRRLGAQVTVVEFLDRITPGMDGDVAKQFQRVLKKQGFTFKLGTKVTAIDKLKSKLKVTMEPAQGGAAETLDCDVALVAIGRKPHTDNLGLPGVGIETDKHGFIPTENFKTSADNIYAIGDVTHGPMLAHKAEEEAMAVAELIAGRAGQVNYNVIPGVVYTHPEVASVGRTEDELKQAGVDYKIGKFPFTANARAKINGDTDGFVKIIADAQTDRVLGVHMIGPHVGELIAEAAIAMEFGASSEDIARTCHAHPTLSEAVRQAAMGVSGRIMQM